MGKKIISVVIFIVIVLLATQAEAQTTTKKPTTKSKTTTTKKTTTTTKSKSPASAVTVKLSSKCEKDLMIFAGPKSQLKQPKQREIGGLSVNTLYLKTGDVVCIMDPKKKPLACVNITKASTNLEINNSGTAFITR